MGISYRSTMVKFRHILLGSIVLKHAAATWQQILNQLQNNTINTSGDKRGPQGRNLLNSAALVNLNKYGCWCYFGVELGQEGMGPGRGEPVDPVDSACKSLHHAYDCIVRDIQEEGGWYHHIEVLTSDAGLSEAQRLQAGFHEECEPWTVSYIPAYYTNEINQLGIYRACESLNEPNVFQNKENNPLRGIGTTNSVFSPGFGRCATLACSVEAKFVESIVLLQQIYVVDMPQFSHSQGFTTDQCRIPALQALSPETECCGNYPDRYSFPTTTGNGPRACCGQVTYDSSMFDAVMKLQVSLTQLAR